MESLEPIENDKLDGLMYSQENGNGWSRYLPSYKVCALVLNTGYIRICDANQNSTRHDIEWKRLLRGYSKVDPPTTGYPTEVKLGIYINSFYSISEANMDYSMSFYLRQSWTDPRLAFTPTQGFGSTFKLPDGSWDDIWRPDVFFRNEKNANYHDISTPNRFMLLDANGTIWYVSKISARLACPMVLKRYPMDVQRCPLMFESSGLYLELYIYDVMLPVGYTSDVMYFTWLDQAAEIDPMNQIPQFTLKDIDKKNCSQTYTAGSFTCLQLDFILQRDIGFFVLQVYIPSMLVVILSWVNFWINIDAVPARVSIGLITVLTMTTQSSTVNASLPKVSYIKAIDVWMSMCLIFVFSALLEYAFVNVSFRVLGTKAKKITASGNVSKDTSFDLQDRSQLSKLSNLKESFWNKLLRHEISCDDPAYEFNWRAKRLDKLSRALFPAIFLIFNIIYWSVYAPRIIEQN